jgi:photosystem II stability/assembly factor-like uncharacterized protein
MKLLFTLLFFVCINFLNAQWQATYLPSQNWPAFDVKSNNNFLYASTNSGVYRSTDNGATWTDLTQGFAASSSSSFRELFFAGTDKIFVRTSTNSVLRSLDGGNSWAYDTSGIGFNGVELLYYDSNSDKLFVGLGWPKYGLYKKSPTDASWTNVTSSNFTNNFSPAQMTQKSGALFLMSSVSKMYKSTDGGLTWVLKNGVNMPQTGSSQGATRFISVGNDLYIAAGGIHKSSNDGDNWTRIDYGFALTSNLFVYNTGLFYDGTNIIAPVWERKTYISPDLGVTWNLMGSSSAALLSFTKHNNTIYAAGFNKDSIFVFGTPSGLTEINSRDLNVYPVPAIDDITITSDETFNNVTIEIHDCLGAKVRELNKINGSKIILKRDYLKSGVYFISIISNKKTISRKKIILTD